MAKINFSETLTLASDKVSRNIYLQSISQGCMSMLPVVIIGSFASLFSGLPVNFWQNFIQSTGISGILAAVVSATTNMLGVFFTYGVASAYAEKLKITNKVAVILALVVYIALLPTATLDTGTTTPSTSYMGTSGMIVGFPHGSAVQGHRGRQHRHQDACRHPGLRLEHLRLPDSWFYRGNRRHGTTRSVQPDSLGQHL